jgi:hypothetical protein
MDGEGIGFVSLVHRQTNTTIHAAGGFTKEFYFCHIVSFFGQLTKYVEIVRSDIMTRV